MRKAVPVSKHKILSHFLHKNYILQIIEQES